MGDLKKKGLDILPHRERMLKEDLENKFKNKDDPLRLVFVCAMWITGFDVPSIGTVYLDKPMRNHTLMQTIARANRNAPGKTSGVIVDYAGVFNNLQKALAIYAGGGAGADDDVPDGDPIKDKAALIQALEAALEAVRSFSRPHGIDEFAILTAPQKSFERQALIGKAVEVMVAPDDRRREFLRLTGAVTRAYKAILPDQKAAPYMQAVAVFHTLAECVRAKLGPVDIEKIAGKIAEIIDEHLEGVAILTPIIEGEQAEGRVELSGIDFEALAKLFEASPKVAAQRLREQAEKLVKTMAEANPFRVQLVERLEKLVLEYNAGSIDAERFFEGLKDFVRGLNVEQSRAAREGLTDEELAIFDLLTTPEPKLTKAQEVEVKAVARQLLEKLRELVEAVNWIGNQQTRGAVWTTIRQRLNDLPEDSYPEILWSAKVDSVWNFVLQRYASV